MSAQRGQSVAGDGPGALTTFTDQLLRFRTPVLVLLHVVIFAASYVLAFLLRFDFTFAPRFFALSPAALPTFLVAKLLTFAWFRQYSGWWRYVSLNDLIQMSYATLAGGLLAVAGVALLGLFADGFPRSIFILDGVLTIGLLAGSRVLIRLARERLARSGNALARDSVRTLLVGTGPSAESLLREINRNPELGTYVVGILAEDERFVGSRVNGRPIVGTVENLGKLASTYECSQVIVAVENEHRKLIRRIVQLCSSLDLKHRVLPTTDALLQGQVSFSNLREVDLRDLLGRPPVRLFNDEIAREINNRVVLVTGAGGSIGSELSRQVANFGPAELVLIEQAENPLFHLERELSQTYEGVSLRPVIADVYDSERMQALFNYYKPALVLHAAAHKHVPLMEANPSEAVKNNIIGTLNVIRASQHAGVETCVLISTDKAVNPTSVMGASKRVSEMLLQALANQSKTRLAAVRFGNVLGSNGSVIPIFKQQIAQGGPVTVTHPEMKRYFMTIPEATQLVLQAAIYANAGDIFVLDMGEPVYIVDVARDLIRLSGLEPERDVQISFSGIRPGEKLFEELATDAETQSETRHSRIFRCEVTPPDPRAVLEAALQLEKISRSSTSPSSLREVLFATLNHLERGAAVEELRASFENIVPFESGRRRSVTRPHQG